MRKLKSLNANFILYSFLLLLFTAASTVDVDAMTSAAMEQQEQSTEVFLAGLGL